MIICITGTADWNEGKKKIKEKVKRNNNNNEGDVGMLKKGKRLQIWTQNARCLTVYIFKIKEL